MILASRRLSPIGLDAGAHTAKAVQVERSRSVTRVVAAASIPRAKPGSPIDATEARRILDALWRQGFSGMRLVLSVPPDHLLTAVMELPARSSNVPIGDIARQELARSSRCEPDQIEFGWWELPGGARAAEGTHVMALGCRHADADAFLDPFESTGAEVVALDAPSPALSRACAARLSAEPGLTTVLELGWTAASLLVLRGKVLVYERSMKEHGLGSLLAEMQTRLGIDAEAAKMALDRIGCLDSPPGECADWELAERAGAFVGAHADSIADEVRLSLAYAERRFGAAPGAVLLSGGGALVPGLVERLRARTSVEHTRLRLADLFPIAAGLESVCADAPLAPALGLALHESTPDPEGAPA